MPLEKKIGGSEKKRELETTSKKEEKIPKTGKAAQNTFDGLKIFFKNPKFLGTVLGLSTMFSAAGQNQDTNREADRVFTKGKEKTEISIESLRIRLPDGKVMDFRNEEEKSLFLELSRLIKLNSPTIEIGNGDINSVYRNRFAEAKKNLERQAVFNSREEIWEAINKYGWNHVVYAPAQVGNKSPFWNKSGSIPINNMEDYKKHVEENLRPDGFRGEIDPDIKHFGFKLEENEFITTLKYNTVVNADVRGGRGYVALLKGTRVIFERVVLENGKVCNILKYLLDCKNAIYGDELDVKDLGKVNTRFGVGENGELEIYYAVNGGSYYKYDESKGIDIKGLANNMRLTIGKVGRIKEEHINNDLASEKTPKKRFKKAKKTEDNDVLQA